jgi:hypothetical protein
MPGTRPGMTGQRGVLNNVPQMGTLMGTLAISNM